MKDKMYTVAFETPDGDELNAQLSYAWLCDRVVDLDDLEFDTDEELFDMAINDLPNSKHLFEDDSLQLVINDLASLQKETEGLDIHVSTSLEDICMEYEEYTLKIGGEIYSNCCSSEEVNTIIQAYKAGFEAGKRAA